MTLTVWRPDLGAFIAVEEPCEITTNGWCATHSTGAGPVYCKPDKDGDSHDRSD